jgi:hypothetical protein
MLSRSGNPTMSNISAVFAALKRALKVEVHTQIVGCLGAAASSRRRAAGFSSGEAATGITAFSAPRGASLTPKTKTRTVQISSKTSNMSK